MATGRYKTDDSKVIVDYGTQTVEMPEKDYRDAGYTPVFEDLPSERDWFSHHREQMPLDKKP